MKDLKIGERITYSVTLEADIGCCEECFFYNDCCCNRHNELECLGKYRSDGKNIIFKLVNK